MFTTNHFIWLALCAAFITGMLFAAKKFKFSFKTATYIVALISFSSELCKILTHIDDVTNSDGEVIGGVLSATALPFHLCSLLIFLFFYLAIGKDEKKIETIKSLITPVAILGGTMALLIPTSGVDFTEPYAYQCFVYHAGIMWYAMYLIMTKQVKLGISSYKNNMVILFALLFIMLWVNSALQTYETNFLYIVKPPMENLPILNLNNGWMAYFFTLIAVALTLFTAFHIPFIIKDIKAKKNSGEGKNA